MTKTILALAALVTGSTVFAAEASTKSYSVTLDNTIASEYIFRGIEVADATFHPSVEVAYGDFYTGVWGALPFNNDNGGDFQEFDFYAGYGYALNDTWKLDVGATHYYYGDTPASQDTTEVYLGVTGKVSVLTTSVYGYYDIDLQSASFIGSAGYSLPITQIGTSLDFTATLGYVDNGQIASAAPANYTYWGLAVAVPYKLSDSATVTTGVAYTNGDQNALVEDQVVGTIGLTVGF
jgi:uncharacterized protein (TIGR02001 family)